jgi:hypothetical protein
MITEGIQDKPLAKFMSGKSLSFFLVGLTYLVIGYRPNQECD